MDAWIDSYLSVSFELLIAVRILFAALVGTLIGLEREFYGRPIGGLRTHILVCVGSALIMCVSMYGFQGADSARLAAQVISGIGFLGAGVIIQSEGSVKGLTTAASLWVVAMIGLAAGNGFYFGVILVTAISLIVLIIFKKFEVKINKSTSKVYAIIEWEENLMGQITDYLKEYNLEIANIETKNFISNGHKMIKLIIIFEKQSSLNDMNNFVNKLQKEHLPTELKLSH